MNRREREQQRINDAYLRQTLATKPRELPACSKHPEWTLPGPGTLFSEALCPHCRDEELSRRDPPLEKPRRIDPGSAGDRLDLRYDLYREKHGEPSGVIATGTFEEANALERISDLRYEEEARQAAKSSSGPVGGVLVSARPVGGRWQEVYRVGRRFVQIGPD
jgi:hypothetical protein